MAVSVKSLRDKASAMTDAEMLRFLIETLEPKVRTIIHQAISTRLEALARCLVQQEELVLNTPDFESRASVLQHITAARLLCDTIQADLGSAATAPPSAGDSAAA